MDKCKFCRRRPAAQGETRRCAVDGGPKFASEGAGTRRACARGTRLHPVGRSGLSVESTKGLIGKKPRQVHFCTAYSRYLRSAVTSVGDDGAPCTRFSRGEYGEKLWPSVWTTVRLRARFWFGGFTDLFDCRIFFRDLDCRARPSICVHLSLPLVNFAAVAFLHLYTPLNNLYLCRFHATRPIATILIYVFILSR